MPQESSTTVEADILERCQEAIGYRFRQPDLLRSALTHASGANTRLSSNERMEFLGDAVLGLITCEQLYIRFPEFEEGDLTKIKSSVVSRRAPWNLKDADDDFATEEFELLALKFVTANMPLRWRMSDRGIVRLHLSKR